MFHLKYPVRLINTLPFVEERCIPGEIKSMHTPPTPQLLIPGTIYTDGVHYIHWVMMKMATLFAAPKVKLLQQTQLTFYKTIRILAWDRRSILPITGKWISITLFPTRKNYGIGREQDLQPGIPGWPPKYV